MANQYPPANPKPRPGPSPVSALDALGALGDPTRRRVFERLVSGPLAVHEIAEGMTVTRPAVSQHLRVLVDARLVTVRSQGTRRLYAVSPDGIEAVRAWMDEYWSRALDGFRAAAEQHAPKED